MDVRLVRPTDVPLVLSLAFDRDAHLVGPPSWTPARATMRTLSRTVLPLGPRGRTWLAQDGPHAALLEAHPRTYVIGWDVGRLAIRGDCDAVLPAVVKAATAHLQSRGVPRLFARTPPDRTDILHNLGFTMLAREFVLIGPRAVPAEDEPLPQDSRYRMPPDAWPLHQLEADVTPALVRQVEGVTSLDWTHQGKNLSEIVVEREGRIVGWVGWGTKVAPGLLEVRMLIHPDHNEVGPALLHHVLKSLPPGHRFVARVREYCAEVLRVFLDGEFDIASEETLMVKHAGMERARATKGLLRVAGVPGIQAMRMRHRRTSPVVNSVPAKCPVRIVKP